MSNCRQEELSLETSELHPDDAEAVEQGAIAVELVAGPEPRRIRGKTQSMKRLSKRDLVHGKLEADALLEGVAYTRPVTRGDCLQGENAQRPCPFVSCKHHLYLDVSPRTGAVKLNFPHMEVWDLHESCALDVAGRDGVTLDELGTVMNLTRERIRQLETRGLSKLRQLSSLAAHADHLFGDIQRPDLNEPEKRHIGISSKHATNAMEKVIPNCEPNPMTTLARKKGSPSRAPSDAMAAALSELRAELGTERLALELDLSAYTVAALCRGDNVSCGTLRKAAEYLAGREQVA